MRTYLTSHKNLDILSIIDRAVQDAIDARNRPNVITEVVNERSGHSLYLIFPDMDRTAMEMKARIAAQAARNAITDYIDQPPPSSRFGLTADQAELLVSLGSELATQDNRITNEPIFMVQEGSVSGKTYTNHMAFFTEKAAQEYIDAQRHNLQNPRIYALSAHANREWKALRRLFLQFSALLGK